MKTRGKCAFLPPQLCINLMNVDVFLNVFSLRLCAWFTSHPQTGWEVRLQQQKKITNCEKSAPWFMWNAGARVPAPLTAATGSEVQSLQHVRESLQWAHSQVWEYPPNHLCKDVVEGKLFIFRVETSIEWKVCGTAPKPHRPVRFHSEGRGAQVMLRAETQPALSYRLGSTRRRGGAGVSQSIWCRPTNS